MAGRHALYAYCAENDVPHRRIGKLLVATTEAEIANLEAYKVQAEKNGVDDLRWLDAAEARELEPAVSCVRGLLSPSTGIVDSHAPDARLRARRPRPAARRSSWPRRSMRRRGGARWFRRRDRGRVAR